MQKAKWLGPVLCYFCLCLQRKRGADFRAMISVATSIGREVKGQWREQELNPRDSYITAVVIWSTNIVLLFDCSLTFTNHYVLFSYGISYIGLLAVISCNGYCLWCVKNTIHLFQSCITLWWLVGTQSLIDQKEDYLPHLRVSSTWGGVN